MFIYISQFYSRGFVASILKKPRYLLMSARTMNFNKKALFALYFVNNCKLNLLNFLDICFKIIINFFE
ncbi:MAG: hypothetical protein VR66_01150 [Peptococcaceae bacterium BRH_c23]|nr:MAG: hypothetical protein VR66_01150 [Peptococcaceae bacterium BRH_c23]KJS81716.1 MAG: hypothetical protein JL57_25925 [Desulfosporosinus sp. BICA1-9]HBW36146.1 hypothetical protein [Desulfosporosinus sp.]